MTKYLLTHPDGRKIEIDSPTPPTEELAQQVFKAASGATQKTPEMPVRPKLQPLTEEQKAQPQGVKASDIAKAAFEGWNEGIENLANRMASGMTFGGTDWLDRHTPGSPQAALREQIQARADAEGLGTLNKAGEFAADVYGNIKGAGGKLAAGIAKTGAKGLKALALNLGLGGAAYGTTASDRLADVPQNALASAVLSELFGGGMYGLGKGGLWAYNVARPYANAAINAVGNAVKKVGIGKLKDIVKLASEKGRNVLEVGDDEILRLTQEARQQSPEAYQNIAKAQEAFFDTQNARNSAAVNDAFGSTGKYQNTDDIIKLAQEQAEPYYQKLREIGDLAQIEARNMPNTQTPLQKVIADSPYLQQEIAKVKNTPLYQTEYQMAKLPDTDWRVLDQVNRNINQDIGALERNVGKSASTNDVRLLEMNKYKLLNAVDDVVPEYKLARGIYEAEGKALRAQKIGEEALFDNNTSAEKLARTMQDMTDYEKASLKIGAREKLKNVLESRENEALGWKKINNEQTKGKLKLVLGDKADNVINYADDETQAMRNYNNTTGGSQTSSNEQMRDMPQKIGLLKRISSNPTGAIGEIIKAGDERINNASKDVLTQLLLEQGGGRLNNALEDYLVRATRAEKLRSLLAPVATVGANRALQIK